MKPLNLLLLPALLAVLPLSALADDHDHGHGRGHGKRGEYKEEFWDGPCKVERKYKKNGDYKEERKCEREPQGYYAPQPVYVQPQPVYVQPQPVYAPAPAPVQPGVTVQGTIRLR